MRRQPQQTGKPIDNYQLVTRPDVYVKGTGIKHKKKSRIRKTPTFSTDADSRTKTNLKRLCDLSFFFFFFFYPPPLPAAVAAAKGLLGNKKKPQGGMGGWPMRGRDLVMWSEGQWEASKKLYGKGTRYNIRTDIATTRPNQPSGPIWWKNYLDHHQSSLNFWSILRG